MSLRTACNHLGVRIFPVLVVALLPGCLWFDHCGATLDAVIATTAYPVTFDEENRTKASGALESEGFLVRSDGPFGLFLERGNLSVGLWGQDAPLRFEMTLDVPDLEADEPTRQRAYHHHRAYLWDAYNETTQKMESRLAWHPAEPAMLRPQTYIC